MQRVLDMVANIGQDSRQHDDTPRDHARNISLDRGSKV
jgi:hypothetical protein